MRRWIRSSFLVSITLGCTAAPPCPTGDLAPPARPGAFAVLLSDYASSAIGLLDADGELIVESWVDSGSQQTAISAGLGGDLALVDPLRPGELDFLGRYQTDVLFLAAPGQGTMRRIDVRGDDPTAPVGASPNPQDALAIDAHRAWVARLSPARDPRAPELALGNDVVVVDLDSGSLVRRIDPGADTQVVVDGAPVAIDARPAALAAVTAGTLRRALVALGRLSADFSVAGPGAVAVIDPGTMAVAQILELPDLANCTSLRPVPGERALAALLCGGPAFAGEIARRAAAALVLLSLDGSGRLSVASVWRASEHPGAPVPSGGLVPLDASRLVAVADPRGEPTGADRLVVFDLAVGTATVALESTTGFVLGTGDLDPASGLLLVPDAELRVVHRFDVSSTGLAARSPTPVPLCRALPPRQIRRL